MPASRAVRLLIAAAAAALLTGCAAERPQDPVVVTGSDVPRAQGAAPGKLLAFRYLNDAWTQIPVQVDERATVDLGRAYNSTPVGISVLTYTDPGTFIGADPDPTIDSNDEIAFMGRDGGVKAPAGAAPAGVVSGSGQEVAVGDALGQPDKAYVYLFRQTGSINPSAGKDYVDYRFKLTSGDYKTTYKLQQGPNPEDTTVTTPFYQRHFVDRWADDVLRVTTPNATGVDILDRHKNLFAPGNCGRSEDTFDAAEGAFIVNKDGPVRAIRAYIGANSGPYTVRQHIFYDRRQDITTYLRVHEISSIMDFYDYSAAASGMTYRSSAATSGVTVDGTPDTVTAGNLGWETIDGAQGGVSIVHGYSTDIAGLTPSSYYLDQKSPSGPAETQCTGDGAAYGSSGPWIKTTVPNTDPRNGAAKRLEVQRSLFYEEPGKTDGPRRAAQITSPLSVAVAPQG